ncbi:MAG TPA: CinA family protein [Nitrolancea sp.]|nr:CinA family protein [Nitrolancea sp.]
MVANSYEEQLFDILTRERLSIATAESCTGGLLSHRITTIPGSSAYFLGGVVAYSNAVKLSVLAVPDEVLNRVGAVSAECALAMARGVRARIGTDIGVSTTGIAGPGGATPTKPVGLVFIACSTPWGDHYEEHRFTGNRIETIRASAEAALACVLDQLARREGSPNY